jgi:hypothetical protein
MARVGLMVEGLLGLDVPLSLVTVAGRGAELARHQEGRAGHKQVGLVALGQIVYVDDLVAAT